jgi:flavin-binding protein dodecin
MSIQDDSYNFKKEDNTMSVYKVIELIGTSTVSWEDAAKVAIDQATKTLRDLRVAEVVSQDLKIEDGKVVAYRTKVRLSFRFQGS